MSGKPISQKKRKRGVRASKIKLHQAMSKAGFKTQASLAEAIADSENLDTLPKDMVSKVFREISVEHSSLERVAKILNVSSSVLYLHEEEDNDVKLVTPENVTIFDQSFNAKLSSFFPHFLNKILLGLLVIFMGYLTFEFTVSPPPSPPQVPVFGSSVPTLGKFSLALVIPPDLNVYATDLVKVLSKNFILASTIKQSISEDNFEELHHLADKYQADFILKLSKQKFGNFFRLSAYLHRNDETYKIWESHNRYSHFTQNTHSYFMDLNETISFSTGLQSTYKSKHSQLINEQAQKYYLEGRNLIDSSEDNLNVKSAQSRFINAISIDENYAEAHAGLCESILHESWMDDEKNRLEDAHKACSDAMKLAPFKDYVISTQAFFLRRTGRPNEAINILNDFHEQYAQTMTSLYSLSYAEYEAYRHSPDKETLIKNARKHALSAIKLAPDFWKPYQILGLIEWTSGNIQASLVAFEKAVENGGSELVVTNLGTLHLCLNNLSAAEDFYRKSMIMSPKSHLGVGRLGTVKYIQKNYTESLKLRQKALDLVSGEGIHQMWGALADSYLQTNQKEFAVEAYLHALTIAERDILRGNFTPFDNANRLFYKTQLAQINRKKFFITTDDKKEIEVLMKSAEDLDNSAIIKLALIATINNHKERAWQLTETASNRCPVYRVYPGLSLPLDTKKSPP